MNGHCLQALMPVLALVGCAATPALQVPDALKPGANEAPLMTVSARGVQIYECRAAADMTQGPAWVFVAPKPICSMPRDG
jgi:hypothetical protein